MSDVGDCRVEHRNGEPFCATHGEAFVRTCSQGLDSAYRRSEAARLAAERERDTREDQLRDMNAHAEALDERIAALERERDEARRQLDYLAGTVEVLARERDALEARVQHGRPECNPPPYPGVPSTT